MCSACNFCGEPLNAVGDGIFGMCITEQCIAAREAEAQLKAQADAMLAGGASTGLSKTTIWIIAITVLIFAVGLFLLVRKK